MSSDQRERSRFFFFFPAAWRQQLQLQLQKEGTATEEEDPAAAEESRLITKAKEPAAASIAGSSSSSRSSPWLWCSRVPATSRGVGLVIGGLVVLAVLLATASTWWTHLDEYSSSSASFLLGTSTNRTPRPRQRQRPIVVPIPFSCGSHGHHSMMIMPPPSPSPSSSSSEANPPDRCPEYFRHIHSDLAPWRDTGITREAVEAARSRAAFRLTVVGGRAFIRTYHRVFQTRDTFTQWGIAQLLARYPGRVPDLDLMFNCEDMPELRAADFFPVDASSSHQAPPPLFRYCKDDATIDIVFPDWSFWGWPEVNIRPWAPLLEEMANETRRLPWPDREPYAYWKGNPDVSPARRDLVRCNSSTGPARVFRQDWAAAIRAGFKDGSSNLAKQCHYRYKIFVQGRSWSVSQKYILACDSPVLLVATPYKDFFSRGLLAGKHYWPIDPARKCPAIEFAVDWGNAHPAAAQRMADEGSGFARNDLSMDYVYDYMLHLLTEYAKLLRYKPTVPDKAVELRPETVACPAARGSGREREFDFMMQSRERYVAAYEPCTLPPPFTADELNNMARRDKQVRAQVHDMMMKSQKKKKHR